MTKSALLCTGLILAALLPSAPAQAQVKKFVSSTGSGATCTRAAPCGSFANAIAAITDTVWGEVQCLDSGPFAGVTITRGLTIDCAGTVGTARVSGEIVVNTTGQPVTLRNLSFDGITTGVDRTQGIQFIGAGILVVENTSFTQYFVGSPTLPPAGIKFQPTGAGHLVVSDALFTSLGCCGVGAAILVNPQPGGTAQVTLNRITAARNNFAVAADGTGSTGGINMTIADSVLSDNTQDGIIAVTPAGGAPIGVYVKNTKSVNNNIGIRSIGSNVTVRVDGSSVTGNGTGLSFSGGGALLTAGNNMVRANGSDGAFSGSVGLQ